MGKIIINLLPPELAISEKQKNKKNWIIRTSSLFIVLVIVITSIAIGFSVVKTNEKEQGLQGLEQVRQEIVSLNDREGYLSLVKQKLAKITSLQGKDAKQLEAFNLVNGLIPEGVQLSSLSLGKNNQIIVAGQSSDINNLDSFFGNLSDDKKNNGKISKVGVDSLNNLKDTYKFNLTLYLN